MTLLSIAKIMSLSSFVLVLASQSQAAEWQFAKGVETQVEHTSQERMSGSESANLKETSTSVAPFVSIGTSGRQTSFNLNARVIANRSSISGESDVRPSLDATSSTYSSSKRLRFDTGASIQQRVVDSPFAGDDTLSPASARERVISLSAGPRFRQRFGSTRIGSSYTVGAATSNETENSGSVVQATSFESKTQFDVPNFGIGTRIDAQHTSFDATPSITSGSFSIFADYVFRRKLTGIVLLGRDLLDGGNETLDSHGSIWGLGFSWKPSSRLSFEAAYLERVFGRQPRLAMRLDGRRSSVSLDWTRTINISAISENTVLDFDDDDPVDEISDVLVSDDIGGALTIPLFQESRNISEKVSLSYTIKGRVSAFTAELARFDRETLSTEDQSNSHQLSARLSRKLSRSSTIVLNLATGKTRERADDSNNDAENRVDKLGLRWNFVFR